MLIPVKPTITHTQTDDVLAKLELQLKYDNLTKYKFFTIIFDAYLDRDQRLISLLEEKNKRKASKINRMEDIKRTKMTIYDFNLEENEINDIFDIIAKENPNL